MQDHELASLIQVVLVAVLALSALFARKLPLGPTLRMAVAWIAIFAAAFVGFSYRDSFVAVWNKSKAELSPGGHQNADGTIRVTRNEDDHFWIDTKVNGHNVRMLIDTGATQTALPESMARKFGVALDPKAPGVPIGTANGMMVAMPARIAALDVAGVQRENVAIYVSDKFGETPVLGMNVLSTFAQWRVEGRTMIITP